MRGGRSVTSWVSHRRLCSRGSCDHVPVATLTVEGDEVVLHLSLWERIVALHGDVRVPIAAVGSARVVDDPAGERKQFASRGNGMPWLLAYGVRDIYGVGKGFIATRGRRPAVLVHLTPPSRFVRLLVSVADPQLAASAITSGARRRH